MKNFAEISKITAVVKSDNSLFSFSKEISRRLGLKTLDRCNALAFHSSLLAQLLSYFLMNEYCVCGRFNILVTFHRE